MIMMDLSNRQGVIALADWDLGTAWPHVCSI